ncbi:galactose-specific lectin nattectin-like [Cheilinus undulatus]|uniref:galactose-specific lectin nattectin-like n=1 Tax=Cheilinus undulatus TaxID=241271 RepID=UPI001BD5C7EE|nr:galactose-specific lectin nattectin-like [Cheilinus undulatus]XP_041655788.1 galactose-specific lectin nattectin-like [Cheilinus undulatus]XP_041655789.1 galactose-specific lectin nattectin-like [Cheilinus undulatus]
MAADGYRSTVVLQTLRRECPMASGFHFILCLASGLWISANGEYADPADCIKPCPPGWTHFDTRCFKLQLTGKKWAEAERHCTSLDGNLASVRSSGEYKFLRDMVHTETKVHEETWLGGYDAAEEDVWLWSDGSPFDFELWKEGEPNDFWGGEDCMEMNNNGQNYINDADCDDKKIYICARDPLHSVL